MKINKKFIRNILSAMVLFLFQSSIALAQESTAATEGVLGPTYYKVLGVFFFVIIMAIIYAFFYFGTEEIRVDETGIQKVVKVTVWARVRHSLTKAAPLDKEDEILMEDDYDGIKELDNMVPPWFNYIFYVTIIFAVYYLFNYEVFSKGKSQTDEYNAEMQAASIQRAELEATGAFVTEENVTRLIDASDIDAGKDIFKSNCVPCHGPDAGGVVGPNLTDKYWIHGGGIKNVFTTIKYGVPSKGMLSWQTQLNPKQMQQVASFVLSLQGSKPANPKEPQGTIIWTGDNDSTQVSK
jgi:cytochrome c oxidase cbb3-type subunit III